MAISYSPKVGQILMCDFTTGFIEPEMVKKRPVIILATRPNGHKLVTAVCLSTVKPEPQQPHHMLLEQAHLPKLKFFESGKETWVKGDMIYSVSFDRLDLILTGKQNGKRVYFINRLSRETMRNVYSCTLNGLNLGKLSQHL
ncbi:type II toxin-antitoxin system PemK/MazF family toxin [Shewanella sp. AC91-MNA-CIBAN-0169]|uniref:type II toxin-antitoxin system PemK/MazF family toxin n=1 Tax=Shewanella sp. AC91-MNA-CIBAN-0169 TaxID=3140466 RepID=UPI0033304748